MDNMTPLERKESLMAELRIRKKKVEAQALHNCYSILLYNKYDNGKMTYERLLYLIEILGRWDLYGSAI